MFDDTPIWQEYLGRDKKLSEDTPQEVRDIYDEYHEAQREYVKIARKAGLLPP